LKLFFLLFSVKVKEMFGLLSSPYCASTRQQCSANTPVHNSGKGPSFVKTSAPAAPVKPSGQHPLSWR
jgi:hypothetical protein